LCESEFATEEVWMAYTDIRSLLADHSTEHIGADLV